MSEIRQVTDSVYAAEKKIKIKKKTTLEKVSFCTFGLEVLVYMTNVCHLVQIKSVM